MGTITSLLRLLREHHASPEHVLRVEKVTNDLLGQGTITSGNDLARRIVEAKLLPHELTDDLEDLLSLPPGWANDDGKGDDTIKEETFSNASMLLVYFYLLDELPYALMESPRQTINFKFRGSLTLIVGEDELTVVAPGRPHKKSTFCEFMK